MKYTPVKKEKAGKPATRKTFTASIPQTGAARIPLAEFDVNEYLSMLEMANAAVEWLNDLVRRFSRGT